MAKSDLQDLTSDPPIVIQGGGSVSLKFPHKFKDEGEDKEYKKYKSESNLAAIEIDGKPVTFTEKSKIVIRFK
ncbi:MAG: hypothetical protein ACR2G4_18985 [Pyrinomonadaceae bacterium]